MDPSGDATGTTSSAQAMPVTPRTRPGCGNVLRSLTCLMRGPASALPTYLLTRRLFVRLLALVYLIAFLSLRVQVVGLIGSRGIAPVAQQIETLRQQVGAERYWWFPTLCWWGTSDGFLNGLCTTGAVLSLLVMAGVAQGPLLLMLWALYLSLSTAGQLFLSFQWDALLLETGLLAIFWAPWQLLPNLARQASPSAIGLWLVRWLLLRLMFLSGITKLSYHDPTWWGWTALCHHYQTQPLPTWVAWYAHQLPCWFQEFACLAMYFIELFVPFLIFGPRRIRIAAFAALVFLQILIAATGNYGFFNLLTVVLCTTQLDDQVLRRFHGQRTGAALDRAFANGRPPGWRRVPLILLAIVIVPVSVLAGAREIFGRTPLPAPAQKLLAWTSPLRSINGYGLFRVMTTTRPEIIVEGSRDGQQWLPYEFKWKPGDLQRRPRFNQPHQPRLDWQMWFAALGDLRGNRWVVMLMQRLLEGAPDVLALLGHNPFPDDPPRYVRAVLYHYEFTDRATRRATGEWWRRERLGIYCPPVSLRRP